jgi:hypothetical protein
MWKDKKKRVVMCLLEKVEVLDVIWAREWELILFDFIMVRFISFKKEKRHDQK